MVFAMDLKIWSKLPAFGESTLIVRWDNLALANDWADDAAEQFFFAGRLRSPFAFVVVSLAQVVEPIESSWFGHQSPIRHLLNLEDNFTEIASAHVAIAVDVFLNGRCVKVDHLFPYPVFSLEAFSLLKKVCPAFQHINRLPDFVLLVRRSRELIVGHGILVDEL